MTLYRRPGETHTSQGRARGQRWGTLDRETDGVPHGPDEIRSATGHSAMKARDMARGPYPDELSRRLGGPIGGASCWCRGELCTPDPDRPGWNTWPGRADGAPHPRGDR